jgi:hypothetical protein
MPKTKKHLKVSLENQRRSNKWLAKKNLKICQKESKSEKSKTWITICLRLGSSEKTIGFSKSKTSVSRGDCMAVLQAISHDASYFAADSRNVTPSRRKAADESSFRDIAKALVSATKIKNQIAAENQAVSIETGRKMPIEQVESIEEVQKPDVSAKPSNSKTKDYEEAVKKHLNKKKVLSRTCVIC